MMLLLLSVCLALTHHLQVPSGADHVVGRGLGGLVPSGHLALVGPARADLNLLQHYMLLVRLTHLK